MAGGRTDGWMGIEKLATKSPRASLLVIAISIGIINKCSRSARKKATQRQACLPFATCACQVAAIRATRRAKSSQFRLLARLIKQSNYTGSHISSEHFLLHARTKARQKAMCHVKEVGNLLHMARSKATSGWPSMATRCEPKVPLQPWSSSPPQRCCWSKPQVPAKENCK